MPPTRTAQDFVALLRELPVLANVFNPWRDHDPVHDASPQSPGIRSANLERYMGARAGRARLLLVGEAPGYQGCRFSGIAMTSERILLGLKPGIAGDAVFAGEKQQSSSPALYPSGANEPTASITWALLLALGLAPEDFIFWNAFPSHPHKADTPLSNRAPTPAELASARNALPALMSLAEGARVIAVGRVAQKVLGAMGHAVDCVRHPAMGGATEFRQQCSALLGATPA